MHSTCFEYGTSVENPHPPLLLPPLPFPQPAHVLQTKPKLEAFGGGGAMEDRLSSVIDPLDVQAPFSLSKQVTACVFGKGKDVLSP